MRLAFESVCEENMGVEFEFEFEIPEGVKVMRKYGQ